MVRNAALIDEPAPVWPVYATYVLALLAIGSGSVAVFRLTGPDWRAVPLLTLSLLVTAVLLTAVTVSAAGLAPEPFRTRLGFGPGRPPASVFLVASLGAPALGTFLDNLVQLAGVELSGSLLYLQTAILGAEPGELFALSLVISLGPALGEELLLRGYVQTRLVQRHGKVLGVLISSLLFGLMHLDPLHSPLAALLGIYLGVLSLHFGTLWISICAHAVNNLFATLACAWAPDLGNSTGDQLVLALVALVLFLACGAFLLRNGPLPGRRPRYPSMT